MSLFRFRQVTQTAISDENDHDHEDANFHKCSWMRNTPMLWENAARSTYQYFSTQLTNLFHLPYWSRLLKTWHRLSTFYSTPFRIDFPFFKDTTNYPKNRGRMEGIYITTSFCVSTICLWLIIPYNVIIHTASKLSPFLMDSGGRIESKHFKFIFCSLSWWEKVYGGLLSSRHSKPAHFILKSLNWKVSGRLWHDVASPNIPTFQVQKCRTI